MSQNNVERPTLSIIGLGKLGSPMVAVFAHKGYPVVGLDLNKSLVDALAAGKAPVDEPRLQELIDGSRSRISATTDFDAAVLGSDVSFIIVPTPSGPDHFFSNQLVLDAVKKIGTALRRKDGYHLVVVTSTVMPGSTGGEIRDVLERASERKVGPDMGLCYNPEFIALGSVVNDMLRPDMILIGESDEKAGNILEDIYKNSTDSNPAIRRMNFVNAELTKISVNTFVTTKISYANMIADLCDYLPGADAQVVTTAIGSDSRIGQKYLKSAIGYGGPCFPRDNKAFAALGRKLGARCDIAEATDLINDHQLLRLTRAIDALVAPGQTVAILGMSYKPDTGVIEEAQGVSLAKQLAAKGFDVVVHDPLATGAACAALGASVKAASSAAEAISQADAVVITTPWNEFRSLSADLFKDGHTRLVIDPWRVLSADAAQAVEYLVPGKGDWGAGTVQGRSDQVEPRRLRTKEAT